MWPSILHKLTLVHDNDLVKVKYGVKLVRHGDESVVRESGAKETLNMSISRCIKAGKWLLVSAEWGGRRGAKLTC